MARPLWSADILQPTNTNANPSAAIGYDNSRVIQYTPHPILRRFRSTSLANQTVKINLGSVKTIAGIALLGTNFNKMTITWSTDNNTFTPIASSPDAAIDQIDGYGKMFLAVNLSAQWLRISMSTAKGGTVIFDGASYWSLGAFIALGSVNTWPRDLPLPQEIQLNRTYAKAGADVAQAGPFYMSQDISTVVSRAEIGQLQTMGLQGIDTPFLWYRNRNNRAYETYLVRLKNNMAYVNRGQSWMANLSLQEIV